VSSTRAAVWARAVKAAGALGLLPAKPAGFTPAELAAEVQERGEDRLARLVRGWYYPASYGRAAGALTDEEAVRLVASLEAEVVEVPVPPAPVVQPAPPRRPKNCELCGLPLPPRPDDRGP